MMPDLNSSLEQRAQRRKEKEEEKSRLPYQLYLDNLRALVAESHFKLKDSISSPKSNAQGEFVCIKEPLDFLYLFQSCLGQDECQEMFRKYLMEKNPIVVEQVIKEQKHPNGLWFNSTQNGINLRPGLENEEMSSPTAIKLSNDAVHALVAGRTGSGKSVFLNSLLFTMMAEYSPWELSLFLADFKKVELSRYLSKYDTPHIKAVAATSEIRYVVSLLTYLYKCMNARQNLFALLGIQNISTFREKYGVILPRVLFLVDEFQQLFLEATSREQRVIDELLTSITKLGRATGFHLLFASQEMTGTLSQSVYANFNAGFALACDAEVSSRIIGNGEASKIDKKGIVLANIGKSREGNIKFKIPFIDDKDTSYFYEYLKEITDTANTLGYSSVHKYYQEEKIKDIKELEDILKTIRDTRKKYLEENSSLFDIVTLGDSVVFNYKKIDYETVFLERGVRKNVGVFSTNIDDVAYVCKLLALNFYTSPKKEQYRHFILNRNDMLMKKYDLAKDLNIKTEDVFASNDILLQIKEAFEKRQKEAILINSYHRYSSLVDFAFDALCFRTELIYDPSISDKEALFEGWREICLYFKNKRVSDIPSVIDKILDDYDGIDRSYFRVLEMLYEKEVNKKTVVQLFEPYIVWIIGAEMVGRFPRGMEDLLSDAMNYNMLFVIAASNDFSDYSMVYKTCDYMFINGNNEQFYTRCNIPFTKKSENAITIDFGIKSTVTQRSFKKFKYELEEIIVPEIDFDKILN